MDIEIGGSCGGDTNVSKAAMAGVKLVQPSRILTAGSWASQCWAERVQSAHYTASTVEELVPKQKMQVVRGPRENNGNASISVYGTLAHRLYLMASLRRSSTFVLPQQRGLDSMGLSSQGRGVHRQRKMEECTVRRVQDYDQVQADEEADVVVLVLRLHSLHWYSL